MDTDRLPFAQRPENQRPRAMCAQQIDGRQCIYVRGHGGEHFIPEDSRDHSDQIRIRVLRDSVESLATERDAAVAGAAAMRKALEFAAQETGSVYSWQIRLGEMSRAALESDAGAKLLAEHAAQLGAYRKALNFARVNINHWADGETGHVLTATLKAFDEVLQSPDPGAALLAEHAAELASVRQELKWLRARAFATNRVSGCSHSTACTIWGDDGQGGTAEHFKEPLPCNCGALENFAKAQVDTLKAELAAARKEKP